MTSYIARRLLFVVLVLVAVSMLVFGITVLLPANVAYLILGPFAPPEQVRALELKLGLTDPIWQQYVRWAGGFLSGNLGESTLMNRPIGPLLMEAVGRSMMFDRSLLRSYRRHRGRSRHRRGASARTPPRPRNLGWHLSRYRGPRILLGDHRH